MFTRLEAIATSSKKVLGTKDIATRSKKLVVAPGITTSNKKLLVTKGLLGFFDLGAPIAQISSPHALMMVVGIVGYTLLPTHMS